MPQFYPRPRCKKKQLGRRKTSEENCANCRPKIQSKVAGRFCGHGRFANYPYPRERTSSAEGRLKNAHGKWRASEEHAENLTQQCCTFGKRSMENPPDDLGPKFGTAASSTAPYWFSTFQPFNNQKLIAVVRKPAAIKTSKLGGLQIDVFKTLLLTNGEETVWVLAFCKNVRKTRQCRRTGPRFSMVLIFKRRPSKFRQIEARRYRQHPSQNVRQHVKNQVH